MFLVHSRILDFKSKLLILFRLSSFRFSVLGEILSYEAFSLGSYYTFSQDVYKQFMLQRKKHLVKT